MAWEIRNGKRMYYRSRRKGKKVTREYFGAGDAARLAAALDACKRRKKRHEDVTVDAIRRQWAAAARTLDHLIASTCLLIHAAFLAAGHDRIRAEGDCAVIRPDPLIDELQDLVARADAGDADALPRIKQLLDEHAQFTDHFGDVAKVAVECWLALYAANNAVLAEATRRKMVTWRASIADPNPSPLEALLIEQIMVCWMQSHYAEVMYAQAIETRASGPVLAEMAGQEEAGQRRLATSLQQLAELRKLLPDSESGTVKLHRPSPVPDFIDGEARGDANAS